MLAGRIRPTEVGGSFLGKKQTFIYVNEDVDECVCVCYEFYYKARPH